MVKLVMPKKCHNKKRKEPIILVVPTKIVESIVEVTTQPIKPTRVPLKYPCIICFSFKHRAFDYPRKIEVQKMFWTKPNIIPTIVAKPSKPNNVIVNVIVVVMTCSQVPKQQVFKEGESMKAKVIANWQTKDQMRDLFIHIIWQCPLIHNDLYAIISHMSISLNFLMKKYV